MNVTLSQRLFGPTGVVPTALTSRPQPRCGLTRLSVKLRVIDTRLPRTPYLNLAQSLSSEFRI
jgi:hypothetical protein